MIETIYYCDVCRFQIGKVRPHKLQHGKEHFKITHYESSADSYGSELQLCDPCIAGFMKFIDEGFIKSAQHGIVASAAPNPSDRA